MFAATASHVHAHPGLNEYGRLTSPVLLVWLAREFDLAGEAFSSSMTCFDTPSPHDTGMDVDTDTVPGDSQLATSCQRSCSEKAAEEPPTSVVI